MKTAIERAMSKIKELGMATKKTTKATKSISETPFGQGAISQENGHPKSANPFDLGTQEADHLQWLDGWEAAETLR